MYFATISTPEHKSIPALFKDGLYYPLPYPDMRAVIDHTIAQGIVPDPLMDGVGLQVAVQAKLTDEGYFLANKVIAKCPSKYEMQERKERGEQMPHGAMPPTSS